LTYPSRIAPVALAITLAATLATPAGAQTGTTEGAVTGTVSDSSKAALPGVSVTLSGAAVMGNRSATTDENGLYRLPALPPGEYSIRFERTGFGTQTREGVRVSLGFTATVNVEMSPGAVSTNVTVSGEAPTIDLEANRVSTSLDASRMAALPGSRDFWAVVAQVPAVAMSRLDVGGSNALTQQPYTAYGLTSAGGVNRGEVEGIMVNEGAGGGGSDFYYTDYGSMAEVAVNAVGNSAEMPNPGVLSQFITKSGGNQYHGGIYFDYESDAFEASNIDAAQIATGLTGSKSFAVTDLNRLTQFRDFNADTGGYLKKDKLWWYGAYRYTVTDQRYPTLLDDTQHTWAPVYTAKATYMLTDKQKLIGYYQHENKLQPDYLGAVIIPGGRTTNALMTANSVWSSVFPLFVWKAEYDWIISPSLLFEIRTGQYHSNWARTGKDPGPRIEDTSSNVVSGGVYKTNLDRSRPQVNGSLVYTKSGWLGTHSFKFGGEYMRDSLTQPFDGFPNSCNCVSTLSNGAPLQVYIYQNGTSKTGLGTIAFYANDTWKMTRRLTVNLGIRFDRQNVFLPAQTSFTGASLPEVSSVIAWNNWGPRFGIAYDITGKGTTVVKASFGQFYLYPGADFGNNVNPNPPGAYTQYVWTDTNGNGHWDPGEQGRVVSTFGGTTSTTFDPNMKNTYTLQGTAYIERQVAQNFSVRSGFVWNGRRQVRASVNVNRPVGAYNLATPVRDPGPDGKVGTADDGSLITAFGLAPAYLNLPVVNITTNLPENSNYYTWEATAIKRDGGGRWTLLGSFAKTWSRESPLGSGSSFTANALINTDDGTTNVYNNWQGKINATIRLKWGINLTPVARFQSGTPFGRTFSATLNYGSATILAEPIHSERTPNVALFDMRSEKDIRFKERFTLTGFFDVYNIFNSNANQAMTTSSGSSWLRPTAITPPRIARLGIKFRF
jgi:hypothetical protein